MENRAAPRDYRHIRVLPLAGALGAEIQGVDIPRPLAAAVVAEIRQALLDHLVLFFHDQPLEPHQQLTLARHFGEPIPYPQQTGLPECPLVMPVVKQEHERTAFGRVWHSDTTYVPSPPMATMLHAVEIPPRGGDTLFANQYLAYESLSEGLQNTLEGLVAVNTSAKAHACRLQSDRLCDPDADVKVLMAEHPVVRTHPETGRKALYVNVGHTLQFRGWTRAESEPLLEYLFRHQVQPEFTCRFRWRVGSLAFWDNRCVQHCPVNDYHGFCRVMHRVLMAGDVPR